MVGVDPFILAEHARGALGDAPAAVTELDPTPGFQVLLVRAELHRRVSDGREASSFLSIHLARLPFSPSSRLYRDG